MHIRCLAVSLVTACLIGPPLYAQVQSEPKPHMAGAELPAASAVEDSPWIAKSTREMTAMRDGKTPGRDFTKLFSKSVAQIAMRDGAQIHTEIYAPLAPSGSLPIILVRTPYGLNPDQYGYSALLREYAHLMKDGYIFVFQDTRGRGASTGHFISLGPPRDRSNPSSTDESTDAYDSIDWIVKNVAHNNGRVGMLGISYGGFLTTRALVDPHPALKAASPQATCVDMFRGDDWHHNGAFRLAYAFDWIAMMENGKPGQQIVRLEKTAGIDRFDDYDHFLELGPLSNVNKVIFHGKAPSWNAFAEHPNLDRYWLMDNCGVLPYIQAPVTVPTLNVGGWFDAEDHYGAIEAYKKYEQGDAHNLNNLVVGPWYHGGWAYSKGRTLGAVDFGSDTAEWYRENIEAPWFAHWLKGKPQADLPEVLSFRTGTNRWERYDSWPPKGKTRDTRLYLQADGTLSFDPPTNSASPLDQFVSDPNKPVPYVPRPITDYIWPEWEMADQRFVDGRPDVLTYETAPLTTDITITGEPVARLFAATTGSDADWVVKLIDVYPETASPENMRGFEFMIAEEVFRARYQQSFEKPQPLVPGKITPYEFSLRSRDHTFKAGHRIMVQIQSTWFPLIDRNPQTFVPNIYEAVQSDFHASTHSIYRSPSYPSHVSLPVNTQP
jgi:uncharacterized protein